MPLIASSIATYIILGITYWLVRSENQVKEATKAKAIEAINQ
jgi:hypothetical protein